MLGCEVNVHVAQWVCMGCACCVYTLKLVISSFGELEHKRGHLFPVLNILTRFQLCELYVQVFFIPDTNDRTWKVVVQKEARSRRVVEAGDEAILNGVGVYNALEAECVNDNAGDVEGGGEVGGDIVDAADVERAQIRFSRGERARARALEERMMN